MFLEGKTALVTGSTSGIGLAIARALAAEGATVTLNGFGDRAQIGRLQDELQAGYSDADLTKPEAIERMFEKAGPIDILVNNAGTQHVAPIDQFPPDRWDLIIALNLSAAFHTIRLACSQSIASSFTVSGSAGGSVVNRLSISSATSGLNLELPV